MKKTLCVLIAAILAIGTMSAQSSKSGKRGAAKSQTTKTTAKKTAAKATDVTTFNGTWANSYSDGIGGMVTDYLTLKVDEANGTARGEYKDENGDSRIVTGKLQGNRLVLFDADGDEFSTINIINENTIKLEGFTGTFKRVKDMESAPQVDIPIPVTEAPVDPAFNEVKKHLEDK